MEITPVAVIRTPFPSKFGVPRQSGLAPSPGRVVLEPPFRAPEALRGIEGFSHLWLIWGFSQAPYAPGTLTVRPPRLGGNERVGVFASRSPFRPNSLGLSCVRLLRVEHGAPDGPALLVEGADLADGTPIYDIKPYLPFADSVPGASGGYAAERFGEDLRVVFACDTAAVPAETLSVLTAVLAQDPRPHYQDDPARVYAFEYGDWHVAFSCAGDTLTVSALERLPGR